MTASQYFYVHYYDCNNHARCEAVFADSFESAIRKLYLRHLGEDIAICVN